MSVQGWNYEPLFQAAVGGVVAACIYGLAKMHLKESRRKRIERARSKFRSK